MTTLAAARPFEFEGVVRLTKIGVSFVVFTIVIGFAAINTGNNALYIGLSFMLASLLLSGVASKNGLQRLNVEFERVREAWAGRPAEGRLRVANRSRIWNVRDVIVTSPELANPIFIPIINRRSEVSVDASFLFRQRGIVQLKTIDLYTRYPFGFFFKKRRAIASSPCRAICIRPTAPASAPISTRSANTCAATPIATSTGKNRRVSDAGS